MLPLKGLLLLQVLGYQSSTSPDIFLRDERLEIRLWSPFFRCHEYNDVVIHCNSGGSECLILTIIIR
ncbi:hypothetical protein MKW98_026027 [Papaver atlanticum]|uniref:Secreted protein n=1 Tax=Papaver atlanticum TaxID=357466 RepID=A0AAD4X5S2_9MAGN|nr:hypothetical protein MKW98_026027 [Papaver atlanticum]